MIRPTARASLRALLLGAALLAGGEAAAEESGYLCYDGLDNTVLPGWMAERGHFFVEYATSVRILENYRRFAEDAALLRQHACACPGGLVGWEETRALIPGDKWTADYRDLAAETRRLTTEIFRVRDTLVRPACFAIKGGQ